MDILKDLENRISKDMSFDELVRAFYEVCLIPVDDDDEMFLFESCNGYGYFDISLVRQYKSSDIDSDEYMQLRLEIRYRSSDFTQVFNTCEWLEDAGALLEIVENSGEYQYLTEHNVKIEAIGAYLDET